MGTTRTAIDAGSVRIRFVAAIEGYDKLLTDAPTAAAVTAWSGTDWSTAIGGLTVDMKLEQSLDPDDPFSSAGGSCTLFVLPDDDDTFGIETSRKSYGAETYLAATMDRDDTTSTVKATSTFDSSGHIHIGTECIAYSGTTSTTFTGLTRGKYSPFTTSSGGRFAHHHRVGLDSNSVSLQPIVSAYPRAWIGRWVGVWAHRVSAAGVLDTKAQAELLYAGRIVEIRDDANTGARVLAIQHVLDALGDAVIGATLWEGEVDEEGGTGVFLQAGEFFHFADSNGSTAKTADPLTVVSGSAANAYQISQGLYSHSDLCARITTWLATAKADGDLSGHYSIASPVTIDGQERTRILWSLSGVMIAWSMTMPPIVAQFLGFSEAKSSAESDNNSQILFTGIGGTGKSYWQNSPPQRVAVRADGGPAATLYMKTRSGTLVDQYDTLPGAVKPIATDSLPEWGLFLLNDSRLVVAALSGSTEYPTLEAIQPAFQDWSAEVKPDYSNILSSSSDGNAYVVRQIFAFEGDLTWILSRLLMSTGTANHNVNPMDALPYGAGAAIPYSLLSDNFLLEVGALPGASGSLAVFVTKATKLSELIGADLMLRWSFPVWRDGHVAFDSWKTPSAELADVTLTEANKAEPSGQVATQRSATTESDQWLRQIANVRYNRNAASPQKDEYRSTVIFEDRVAVDSSGDTPRIATLNLRNTYREFAGSGQSVEALLPQYMALLPLISRPANIVRRSISQLQFLSISVGDVVLLTDAFARDPETGRRGITERPALVVRHMWTPGGLTAGSDSAQSQTGEVDLFFTDINTDRLSALYVPSGNIDSTYGDGDYDAGYNSVTNTLRLEAHAYSESSESVDAANFPAGYKVLVIERDPLDATAPVMWEREVGGISSSDVTLTSALSSPAWDPTKKYRIIFQSYDDATSTQRAKAFQADDADGLVIDTAQPYLYGSGSADSTYTAEGASPDIELVPDAVFVDGFPRDVGHEVALIRQIDNGMDYKSCVQQPLLLNAIVSNVVYSSGYRLVAYWPIFLSYEILSNAVYRQITAAVMARSYDGTSTSARLSLYRARPSVSSLNALPSPIDLYSQAEWTGITSTTMAVLADKTLTANVKHPFEGRAWLVLELGYKCQSYGLSKFVEGKRQTL